MSVNGDENEKPQGLNNINILYNHLKIPDAVKDLPKYDGNRHTLFEFIENVNDILEVCDEISGVPCTRILLRAIRNKIIGEANEVLNMYGTPLNWDSIRENLISHYADKRSEINLIRDLHTIQQNNSTLEEYYSKIIDLQSTMVNHCKINESNSVVIGTKTGLFKEMCLATFLAGLKEPLGSMVRAMQPDDITEAFTYCIKEQNIQYAKKTNYGSLPIPNKKPLPTRHFQQFQQQYQNTMPHRQYNPQYNTQPVFQHRLQTPQFGKPINTYYNHRPFNQTYQQRNPNISNKIPALLPPKLNPPRRFEPMDTTSINNKDNQPTRFAQQQQYNQNSQQTRNFFQPHGSPRFQSQELFNIENPSSSETYPEIFHENYYPNLDGNPNEIYTLEEQEIDYSQEEPEIDETNGSTDFRQTALDPSDISS